MTIDFLTFAYPNPGKEARCHEVIEWAVQQIKENEAAVTECKFFYMEGGDTDLVGFLRIDDGAVVGEMKHQQELWRTVEEEELLRKPLVYVRLEEFCGFGR